MQFKDAYLLMKENGIPIKLPEWSGYWAWENESIKIHCADGRVLDIKETEEVSYTFEFIIRDDWEIADETNSKLLQGEVVETFGLGEALRRLQTGKVDIARKGWNGADQYLYYMTAQELSKAFKYGYGEYQGEPRFTDVVVLKTTNNVLIVGWTPTTTDMNAKDYYVVTNKKSVLKED